MNVTTQQRQHYTYKELNYPIIIWISIVHIIALAGLWTFSWENFFVMLSLYFLTGCVGITLTYHRLLTHRSFQVPKWFERVLATIGNLALQGGPSEWVGHHRMHHAGADTEKDPHNSLYGFFYCHWGWIFRNDERFDDPAVLKRFSRDIGADPYYRFLDNRGVQALMQIILGITLGLIGGWQWIVWGVFIRLTCLYHSTWLVNSAAHIWGYTNYDVKDSAKNNWVVALLTFGEGWHNNHHAYGEIAPAGHKWWEFDLTYQVIKVLKFLGLARNIKTLNGLDDLESIAERSPALAVK